jgi:hypothetical protein
MSSLAPRLERRRLAFNCRVAARRHLSENFLHSGPRSRERDCRAGAKRNASLLSPDGVLRQIALAAAGCDPNAEAALIVIENEGVLCPGRAFESFDSALREPH